MAGNVLKMGFINVAWNVIPFFTMLFFIFNAVIFINYCLEVMPSKQFQRSRDFESLGGAHTSRLQSEISFLLVNGQFVSYKWVILVLFAFTFTCVFVCDIFYYSVNSKCF